jgi:alcohol dehydrogenase (NADP+)
MSQPVFAYAAHTPTADLVPYTIERRELRADDVRIEILYCGVCHSDLHMARNDWGGSMYPVVPGHEIIGRVLAVGSRVTRFNAGDYVGVGCLVDSCRHCYCCEQDHEQYCLETPTYTYNGHDRHDKQVTLGGYSEQIVVAEHFVLHMPQGLDLSGAAPLLCAGITVWSPLQHWQTGPGKRVAVVGLGGLGHMALKLAKALGADVTLFTRSPGKEADARRLGADHIVLSADEAQMSAVVGRFDLIIDTVPYMHDLNPYIPTLAVGGTLVLVGYLGPLEPALNSAPMVMAGKTVAGSLIGGLAETQQMLDFCARHGVTADIELIDIQQINRAYQRMLQSDVKYRFVIDMASLKA